jgi:glycosyltransferase involved in cell wall biosynthesis
LHLIDSAEVAGGQRYLLDLIRHSSPSFEHIVVLAYQGPFEGMLKDQKCPYVPISLERKISLNSLKKIINYVGNEKITIVHTHGYRSNLYGRLASTFTGVRNITTIHVSLYDYVDTHPFIRRIYLHIEKITSPLTSKYICISEAMKKDLRRMGIKNEKIIVVHNGVDLDIFHPRQGGGYQEESLKIGSGIGADNPVIGTVGRMVTEKGQIYLIDALSLLRDRWPKLRCLFVGEGPLFSMLKNHAKLRGVADSCVFPGVCSSMEEIYPLMQIFVLPSLREPFGLVLLEAMATRIPVIATSAGGPLDFIQSDYNGILVPRADPQAIAAKIDFLLSNPDQSQMMAQRGYETAESKFNIKETARELCAVYHSLC